MPGVMNLEPAPPAATGSRVMRPWPKLSDGALHGVAGRVVTAIGPRTEADPAGLHIQLLVAVGNIVGRSAFCVAGGSRHYANLNAVLVGKSSIGRKGTSLAHVLNNVAECDAPWMKHCRASGLSSGEGLIFAVRDPVKKTVRKKGGEQEEVVEDEGVSEKRLLVAESEFAQPLRLMKRDGNILSTIIRQAWDTGDLRTLTKANPIRATGAHISIIGHITAAELARELTETDALNGFANRFLWACVQRSRSLPDGDDLAGLDLRREAKALKDAVRFGQACEEMERDEEARRLWHEVYPRLTADVPGLLGSLLARATAQTLRLSMIYALLDCSRIIRREHLKAALALWDFCEQSARYIFGENLGDKNADRILAALRNSSAGMTRTEINESVFKRNLPSEEIARCLELLTTAQLAYARIEETEGRAAERWFAWERLAATNVTK